LPFSAARSAVAASRTTTTTTGGSVQAEGVVQAQYSRGLQRYCRRLLRCAAAEGTGSRWQSAQ
jgi:hypothetical protein